MLVNAMFSGSMAAAAEPVRILALGDSLTAGYNLPASEAFPVKLEAALKAKGHQVTVINAGVSGDTTAGGLARLDWALADRPQAAIVELGANDMLRGLDPGQTFANLDAILGKLKGQGVRVLLAGMKAPPNLGPFAGEFNAVYPKLADKHKIDLYPFFLDGVASKADLNQGDGIHPTAKGVDRIVEGILPKVRRLIDGLKG
jgi:acyl-CoA thioesterase-1